MRYPFYEINRKDFLRYFEKGIVSISWYDMIDMCPNIF